MRRKKILAIDFDGVIYDKRKKEIMPGCGETLRALKEAGYTLVLWTCRSGNRLANAKNILRKHGLYDLFSSFNENPPDLKLKYKISAKLLANIYIDDGNLGGFPGWQKVARMILNKNGQDRDTSMEHCCVALFGTRNEDNLNRIYRLCAWFGVGHLAVVGSSARVKGNLFSAKGQVNVKYLPNTEEFLAWWRDSIVAAIIEGGELPSLANIPIPAAFCFGSETEPVPAVVRRKADVKITIPKYGQSPCLTADQAAAIVLYAARC